MAQQGRVARLPWAGLLHLPPTRCHVTSSRYLPEAAVQALAGLNRVDRLTWIQPRIDNSWWGQPAEERLCCLDKFVGR